MLEPTSIDPYVEDVRDYNPDYPSPSRPPAYPSEDDYPVQQGYDDNMEQDPVYVSRRDPVTRAINCVCRNPKTSAVAFGVTMLLTIIISLAAGGKNHNAYQSANATHQSPVKVDPDSVDPKVTAQLLEVLLPTYERHNLDASELTKKYGDTPQKHALHWLATNQGIDDLDHTELIQRYALATFYYSTNEVPSDYAKEPRPWKEAHRWLNTKTTSCDWEGIVCNDSNHVISINLEKNHLSGTIPRELAMIYEHLVTLDVSDNDIYMHGNNFDVFTSLKNLQTLILEDNYLVTTHGLPWQFKELHQLKVLRLSYNLMSGELADVHGTLGRLKKLTHLELEANFFNGTLPTEIKQLSNLEYLYLRRNALDINLEDITKHSDTMPNLFTVWLDANKVTGTIPPEIGNFPKLASISITDTQLTGPIPTEMGKLTALRRVWLSSNQLTGSIPDEVATLANLEVFEIHNNDIHGGMPSGICDSVTQSNYTFKSLTTDCDKVHCHGCCTKCF